MKRVSSFFLVLVMVCFVFSPFPIDAHDGYLHAKGEMITVYESNTSWALNPRMSGDKLFFMVRMNNNVSNKNQQCVVYDAENMSYTIIHNTVPNTSIKGGYSWKACAHGDYMFWQLWETDPETEERIVHGNLTNLETLENTRFEIADLDPRVGINDDGLYIFERNDERNFSTLYKYSLENPNSMKKKISALIDYSNQDTPQTSGNRVAFSKTNSDKSVDIFIYDSKTEKIIQVTNEDRKTYSEQYSLQGDYLYYYSGETEITCFEIKTGNYKVAYSFEKKSKRDEVRMRANPGSNYLLLDISEGTDDPFENAKFKNYLRLYDPRDESISGIHISNTYEPMGVFGVTMPSCRFSDGSKVVFQKPNDENYFYIFDGETGQISRIEIGLELNWHVDDYYLYGKTIVWTQRCHYKRADGSSPRQLKVFRLEE